MITERGSVEKELAGSGAYLFLFFFRTSLTTSRARIPRPLPMIQKSGSHVPIFMILKQTGQPIQQD
jgi:hypothetical protein